MAIKVEVQDKQQDEISFPCLMVGSKTGRLALITGMNNEHMTGVDIITGEYCDAWRHDMFKPLTGSITLSNQ